MLNYKKLQEDILNQGYSYNKECLKPSILEKIECWYNNTNFQDVGYQAQFENKKKVLRKARRLFWNNKEFWKTIFEESYISQISRELFYEPTLIFHALFNKDVGGSEVELHQDQFLWDIEYSDALNIWFCLDKTTKENGCIKLYPQSHRLGLIEHFSNGKNHKCLVEDQLSKIGLKKKYIEMNPGDILMWDRFMVHGSDKNESNFRRRGIVMVIVEKKQIIKANIDSYSI